MNWKRQCELKLNKLFSQHNIEQLSVYAIFTSVENKHLSVNTNNSCY